MHVRHTSVGLLCASLALGLGLACPGSIQAQTQASNSGRALDANPQVGSGGVNAAGQQPDFRLRNDVITGDVGSGRQFRGSVDYRAPGALSVGAGSDDLFRFRADTVRSAPASPFAAGDGFSNQGRSSNTGLSLYSTYTTVSPIQAQANTNALVNRLGSRVGNGLPQTGVVSSGLQFGGLPQSRTQLGSSLGVVGPAAGETSPQALTASPLLGLRRSPLNPASTGLQADLSRPLFDTATPSRRGSGTDDAQEDPRTPAGSALDNRLDVDLGVPSAQDKPLEANRLARQGEAPVDEESTADAADPTVPFADGNNRVNSSLLLGTQLQQSLRAAQSQDPSLSPDQRARRDQQAADLARRRIFGSGLESQDQEAQTPAEMPDDPYEALLARLRAGETVPDSTLPGEQPADADSPELSERNVPDRPAWLAQLAEVDEDELESAESKSRQALARALGLESLPADGDAAASETDTDNPVSALLNELDYDLPRLASFAGEKQTRLNGYLKRAEARLADQQYFAAEAMYRQILLESDGELPLVRAGLIHAQMGAGMIRSASHNLRILFESHPELIALRYEKKLLPPTDRLRWLQSELQDQIKNDQRGANPGLLLAYLGYQAESPNLVRYGLFVAQTHFPRDPLLPVLQTIWIDDPSAGPRRDINLDNRPAPDEAP